MDDAVDTFQRAIDGLDVTDVPDDELNTVGWLRYGIAVHLRLEAVEHHDVIAAPDADARRDASL